MANIKADIDGVFDTIREILIENHNEIMGTATADPLRIIISANPQYVHIGDGNPYLEVKISGFTFYPTGRPAVTFAFAYHGFILSPPENIADDPRGREAIAVIGRVYLALLRQAKYPMLRPREPLAGNLVQDDSGNRFYLAQLTISL